MNEENKSGYCKQYKKLSRTHLLNYWSRQWKEGGHKSKL